MREQIESRKEDEMISRTRWSWFGMINDGAKSDVGKKMKNTYSGER
jgi:hypothetical protein